jgi:hypothetical protein
MDDNGALPAVSPADSVHMDEIGAFDELDHPATRRQTSERSPWEVTDRPEASVGAR